MNKRALRYLGFALAIYVVAIVLWRLWVPNLTSFEAPGWDEADRSHDALVVFRALTHFNPWPLISQLLFFQTWGPLFAVFAQVPLFLFGSTAQSLTFVSFSGLIFASLGTFIFIRSRLGWFAAVASCLFAFFWLVGAPSFGPYFVIMMLESWVIVGWLGIAVAGAIADVDLLIIASWILFSAKYQYFPIFFASLAIYIAWNWRAKFLGFANEFFAPKWTRVLFALAGLLIAHVLIMKVLGPIYGKESWNQPRALRNPVLAAFIIGSVLLFARREVFYSWFIERSWEESYIKWFFWPATVLMAFPWPNRWAGIMVTQSFQSESRTLLEVCTEYARDIVGALQVPEAILGILTVLLFTLVAFVAARFWSGRKALIAHDKNQNASAVAQAIKSQLGLSSRGFDFKSLPFFVFLIFVLQILILLFAVKNMQARFAFAVFLSVPVGLFVYMLSRFGILFRQISSAVISLAILAIFIATPYFQPNSFFLGNIHEHTNSTYFDYTELYPLDRSLGPLITEAAKKTASRPVRFAVVQKGKEWLWDRPMKLWPIEFELHSDVASEEPIFYVESEKFCDLAKADNVDLLVRATSTNWEPVTCP